MDHETVDQTSPLLALGSRWAIRPEMLARLGEIQRGMQSGPWTSALERAAARTPRALHPLAAGGSGGGTGGAVAVIPLTGVLTPRGSFLSMLFGGGGGLVDFRDAFREAVRSPDVGAIVLDVDSPGGLVDLVPETAAEIRDARGSKPIVAVANTLAASGAYWIASQADELVVTPSGDVGSVGVYVMHEDRSAANERMGIVVTYVHAGEYKVEGNPDQPLSEEAQAAWQQEVDDIYGMFVNDVAAGRGVTADAVRADYGQGRTLNAQRALAAGMVDRVDTLEGVVGGLLTGGSSSSGAAARAGRLALTAARRLASDATDELDEQLAPVTEPQTEPETAPIEPPEEDEPSSVELDAEARAALASVLL